MGGESFVSFEESTSLKWRLSTRPVVASQMLLELCCCRLGLFLTEALDNGRERREEGGKYIFIHGSRGNPHQLHKIIPFHSSL